MAAKRECGGTALMQCAAVFFCLAYNTANAQAPMAGDIMVTALKRERPLLQTPLAVSTVDADDLRSGFGQTADLQWLTRSVEFTPGSQPQSTTFAIRGVATLPCPDALDRSVGTVWDDVGQATSVGENINLVDVERIEVARGPQGTLFGESATAGLIHVVTAKPAFEKQASLAALYGSENERRLTAVVNTAFKDVALRVATWRVQRDGFVRAPNLPEDLGDQDESGMAHAVALAARGLGSESYPRGHRPRCGRTGGDASNLSRLFIFICAAGPRPRQRRHRWPRNFATSANGRSADKLTRESATFRYDQNFAGMTATSVTGWRLARGNNAFDPDYTDGVAPAPDIYLYDATTRAAQMSQELRLASAPDGPIDFVVGAIIQRSFCRRHTQNQAALRLAPCPSCAQYRPTYRQGQHRCVRRCQYPIRPRLAHSGRRSLCA